MNLAYFANTDLLDKDGISRELREDAPVPALKKALAAMQKRLDDKFLAGESIRALVFGRAWAMDELLFAAWSYFNWHQPEKISLVAVGGYGRGELLPHSDIDLLVVCSDERAIEVNAENLQAFVTLLWDIKLNVGHSVRSVDSCIEEATRDITVTTNLMESRTIVGDDLLRKQVVDGVSPENIWPSQAFFKAKMEEQKERHHKFNDSEFILEPNVKGGLGTLRDIQMIGWVVKRHYGDEDLPALVKRGFLTAEEFSSLIDGQDFLWRIRYALHMISGREEDRLLFNLQVELASLFGYQDTDGRQAVELLMQDYFRQVFNLRALNIILLQHFSEAILNDGKDTTLEPINSRFQICNQYLEVNQPDVFIRTPSAMMEAFVLWAQDERIKGIRANTLRLMQSARKLIDGAFRQDLRNITFFLELLRSPEGVYHALRAMNRYGILGLYLPEFGKIVGQMQFDLFHLYTVDEHSLLTLRNLRSFRHDNNTRKFPLATQIIHRLAKVELLYIAAIYHDIGKGRNADHSIEGAMEVKRFGDRHRLSKSETDLIVWLVRYHLLMSMTAQRQDISDPEIIHRFAQQVGTLERLDYLYALTVADIHATNPNLWNSWRASLLEKLYLDTRRALLRGLENPIDKDERIHHTKDEATRLLIEKGFDLEQIKALWGTPGEQYFLRETPENIAWHTEAIANHGLGTPLVLFKETNVQDYAGGTQIFIYAPDRPHLFADIAATLDALQLDIHDARIMTSSASNFSLDTFIVLEQDGTSIGQDPQRLEGIRQKLLQEIENPLDTQPPQRHLSRQLKYFQFAPEIIVSNDLLNNRTVVEIVAADRPGLLADIGRSFRRLNLELQSARIATMGEQIEDVFFVVDADGEPIKDPDVVAALQDDLRTTITEVMAR